MSYGVFRLNGRGGKGLVLIALFEENEMCFSDSLLLGDFSFYFEEAMQLVEKEISSIPAIALMSTTEIIEPKAILSPVINKVHAAIVTLSDTCAAEKPGKSVGEANELTIEDSIDIIIG